MNRILMFTLASLLVFSSMANAMMFCCLDSGHQEITSADSSMEPMPCHSSTGQENNHLDKTGVMDCQCDDCVQGANIPPGHYLSEINDSSSEYLTLCAQVFVLIQPIYHPPKTHIS